MQVGYARRSTTLTEGKYKADITNFFNGKFMYTMKESVPMEI